MPVGGGELARVAVGGSPALTVALGLTAALDAEKRARDCILDALRPELRRGGEDSGDP
jgi:hypothetical protein